MGWGKGGWEAGLKQTNQCSPLCKTETGNHTALFIGQSQSGIANSFHIYNSREEAWKVSHNLIFCQVVLLTTCFDFWKSCNLGY